MFRVFFSMRLKRFIFITLILLLLALFMILMLLSTSKIKLETSAKPLEKLPHILIDPGHGGQDGGAVCNGVLEKDINLPISQDTADLIKLFGFEVSMTRTDDSFITDKGANVKERKLNDMKARLELYNCDENNVIISIHQNKFSDSKAHGSQIFYSPNNDKSKMLAQNVKYSLNSLLQTGLDRECKAAGKSIYLLKNTHQPAVIVECGFISNFEECQKLKSDSYQKQLAFAITTGLLDYYNTYT